MSYHHFSGIDGLGIGFKDTSTSSSSSSAPAQFTTLSPGAVPMTVSDIRRTITSGTRAGRVAAMQAAQAAPKFIPWSTVAVPYAKGISQFVMACQEWGSSAWGDASDPYKQAIPGSGGSETIGGFVDAMKGFITGDMSQYNRIVNRLQDLATNPQATPNRMRSLASSMLAQTKYIYDNVFNGVLSPGVDVDPNAPAPSTTGTPAAVDPALLAMMYQPPVEKKTSMAIPLAIAAAAAAWLATK